MRIGRVRTSTDYQNTVKFPALQRTIDAMPVSDERQQLQYMLEAVGYGFLMENGSPELRSRVLYLAPPNTEYGVARVLQQVLRQKGCVCPADFTKAH